jgi:ABC-2 type transport system permease protein
MRLPVVRDLWLQRVALMWWCIGFAVLAGFMTSVAAPAADALRKLPVARSLISTFGRTNLTVAFIGTYSLGIAALLTAIYAVTQVGRWAADDAEGRLALVLSTPTSRARVVIERGFVLLVSCVPLAVVTGAVTLMVASRGGISLDLATLWAASFLLLPFALTFGAVGAALTSWRPRIAMGILIALAAISYLLQTYAPLVRWPAWTLQLSVFHLYGTPFVDRDNVGGLLLLVGVSLAGFVVAIAAARRADVAG